MLVTRSRRILRFIGRWTYRLLAGAVLAAVVIFLISFHKALYHRFYFFPKQEAALDKLRATRIPPTFDDGFNEYRGVLHAHSERSHDSEITFPEILDAAHIADIDFLFMSDHCVDGQASYAEGWRGLHEGVLFVRGYEMGHGFMPWGLPEDVVLDCGSSPEELAEEIAGNGGVLFFAHSEEERLWDLPQLTGMEIYNIHTDFKDLGYAGLLPDLILNLRRYPDLVFRLIFERQTAIIEHWDELNKTRNLTGISANDAHQNNGARGVYTKEGTLLLEENSGSVIDEYNLNPVSRLVLRSLFGPLEPGKRLFAFGIDPYERSLRFVNTHILASELTEPALIEALREGRAFVAFDMLADARGFNFVVQNGAGSATCGQTLALLSGTQALIEAPYDCRFRLIHDGIVAAQHDGRQMAYTITAPGKYRVEAELDIAGTWTPWIYTNPLSIVGGPALAQVH